MVELTDKQEILKSKLNNTEQLNPFKQVSADGTVAGNTLKQLETIDSTLPNKLNSYWSKVQEKYNYESINSMSGKQLFDFGKQLKSDIIAFK